MKATNEQQWTLGRAWEALRKFWIGIIVITLLGGVLAYGASSTVTPTYQARASLFFTLNHGDTAADLSQGSLYTQSQMESFAQLASSSRVLQPVIDDLGLDRTPTQLNRSLDIVNLQDTVILEVRVTSESPEQAAEIANSIAESTSTTVRDIASTEGGDAAISANLIEAATVPSVQVAPNKTRDTALGLAAGFLVSVALAFVLALMDTRIPTVDVLTQTVRRPILGTVSRFRKHPKDTSNLVVARNPLGPTSEEFRRIRSSLAFTGIDGRLQRMLVTSCHPSEGKSTFASNLALTIADLQHRVLLIDADLRRPSIAQTFGIEGAVGLTDVLVGEVEYDDAVLPRGGTALDVLPSGPIPPNPAQLLTSTAMAQLLDRVAEQYEFIIIDAPPMTNVADAHLLAPLVDGAIIMVDAKKTRRATLRRAVEEFESAGGAVAGLVLNRVRKQTAGYYESDDRGGVLRRDASTDVAAT